MEVHTHTHTARKKWTHYFWEFLMLFLAVTAGFFVENMREHKIEYQRSEKYARALIEDLKRDTAELGASIKANRFILTCFDSIGTIIMNFGTRDVVPCSFYYYSRMATLSDKVVWHKATLTQIMQSGSLRYFRPALVENISFYYDAADYTSSVSENDKKYRDITLELRSRILNAFYFKRYSHFAIYEPIADSLMLCRLPLQNKDPDILNEYINSFENRRASITILLNYNLPLALKNAKDLISMLNKEYRMD
jgi:hypothetical protein